MTQNSLKQGVVVTYQVLQNTTNYQLRLSFTGKGLWVCIQQSNSIWKLTITSEMVDQTVAKASAAKESILFKEFMSILVQALLKSSERWTLGIMTPIQLEVMRGGTASKQANNTKIYMILSDKEKKFHYPFTLNMGDMNQKEKLSEAIRTMKAQLQQLKAQRNDKSQSSFSILSETLNMNEQIKLENQQMKKKIKMYEESLTQKRGAVEIDIILKEKNTLQLQALTKKRQQLKEIAKYKNMYQLIDRQNNQINNEIELINREVIMLEDSVGNSNKLKSHALKVIKTYENQLRTLKKVLQKQIKEIQNGKKNVLNSKNNERKVLGKIKQIQLEIDQSKKKANIKQISNRLHSVGKSKGSSVDSPSNKSQSIASSNEKPSSQTSAKGPTNTNIVRDNLLKKNMPKTSYNRNLLQTSPNIKMTQASSPKEKSSEKMPGRAINTSYKIPTYTSGTNPKLFNTQKYQGGSKSQNEDSVKSESVGKKQISKEERQKQKKAIDRLTQNNRTNIMKAPSLPKETANKGLPIPRANSQKQVSSSLNKPTSIIKKDNPKDLLQKMKDIKAQYNKRTLKTNQGPNNIMNKVNQLTNKLK